MDIILSAYFDGCKRISLRSSPLPKCPDNHALVSVSYAGICGSDLLQFRNFRTQSKIPIGHEFSGHILDIKDIHGNFQKGDRVCVGAVAGCGTCQNCKSGQNNLCQNRVFLPNSGPGGFSQVAVVPFHSLYKIPNELTLLDAALVEPFSVALHTLRKVNSAKTQNLLIIGAGTIGLAICQLAKLEGFKEISILCRYDFQADVAQKLGAIVFMEGSTIRPNSFDLVINTIASTSAMNLSVDSCKMGKAIIICGGFYDAEQFSFRKVVSKEIEICGSICSTKKEITEIIELMSTRNLRANLLVTHVMEFKEILSAFLIADNKMEMKSIKVLISINGA